MTNVIAWNNCYQHYQWAGTKHPAAMYKYSKWAMNICEVSRKNLLRRVRVCRQLYVSLRTDIDKSMPSDTHRLLQSLLNQCRVIHCLRVECRLPVGHTKDGVCVAEADLYRNTTSGVPKGGGFGGVQTPPPKFRRPSKKSCQTQPDCENC